MRRLCADVDEFGVVDVEAWQLVSRVPHIEYDVGGAAAIGRDVRARRARRMGVVDHGPVGYRPVDGVGVVRSRD